MIIFQLKGERLEQERRRDQAERILEVIFPPKLPLKQARKSSEDAQATGYAQFEKVWAG